MIPRGLRPASVIASPLSSTCQRRYLPGTGSTTAVVGTLTVVDHAGSTPGSGVSVKGRRTVVVRSGEGVESTLLLRSVRR